MSANIPGILGFVTPGAYSLVEFRSGPVSLPGGPTVIAILGRGRREEFLVTRAVGGGKDGAPAGFNSANDPDGRHFIVSSFPVVPGSIEVFINPVGDGTDLPLIQIIGPGYPGASTQDEANAWFAEFGDNTPDSGTFGIGGGPPDGYDSLDAYQGASDGSGFFDSKWGRQYQQLRDRLGITAGSPEPNHYLFDQTTGRLVLDQPLKAFDALLVSYLGEADLNAPELMFDLQSVITKHGFPSTMNTISLAAQMAFENGAGVVVPVHAGEVIQTTPARRLIAEPTLFTALKALEKFDTVDILVPVLQSRVYNEIVLAFYAASVHGPLTADGYFLQENGAGTSPGISVSPLATIPVGQPGAGGPVFLEVFLNGRLLEYGVDYTAPNLDGTSLNGTTNVLLAFSPNYPGGPTNDNTLEEGDRVVVNYLPSPSVINLVATSQLAVLNHCQIMSETKNREERTCLLGSYEFVDLNFILDPITGIDANFGISDRAMFFWPGGTSVNRVIGGVSFAIDGQFIAASAAGFCAANPIPTSLTNKTLTGFTINSNQKLSVDETNLVGSSHVAIVAPLAAGGKVVIGQTTTTTGRAVQEEYSIVRIRDYVAKTTRKSLENAFTGGLITPNTTKDIKIATTNILAALQSQGIITSFQNVNTVVDPQEPRQVDVTFDITPVFPLNWIFIRFSIGA